MPAGGGGGENGTPAFVPCLGAFVHGPLCGPGSWTGRTFLDVMQQQQEEDSSCMREAGIPWGRAPAFLP